MTGLTCLLARLLGYLVSSYITVEFFNNGPQLRRVYKATIRQRVFAHDYAVLQFRDWNVNPLNVKPGMPMKITVKNKEYYGYVHHIENEQANNKNFTKVGFVGASFVMKQASQKIYKNMSADQIIAEIAAKYKFAYNVIKHPRIYTQVSQAGMTDWEFMVYLAKQCGYFLRAENTEIHFYPVTKDFDELASHAPIFQKSDGGFKPINPIYSFTPKISETLDVHGFRKTAVSVAGVNPVDNSYFKITKQNSYVRSREYSNPEFFDSHATAVVANDYETARHLSDAGDENSRFPYSANVVTSGEISLRPCAPIYLNNVGSEYSGYWTIMELEHIIDEKELNKPLHTCNISVATDSLGTTVSSKAPVKPPVNPTRKVRPNQKNFNIKPKTVVYNPNVIGRRNRRIQLVDRINRANQSGPFVATSRWGSTHRDLNYRMVDERMPQAVWQKVRSNAAL